MGPTARHSSTGIALFPRDLQVPSSCTQQVRADIFGALCEQRCPVADALITSSGEKLSGSSSTVRRRCGTASARCHPGKPRSPGSAAELGGGAERAGQRRRLPLQHRGQRPASGAGGRGGAGQRKESRRAASRGHTQGHGHGHDTPVARR